MIIGIDVRPWSSVCRFVRSNRFIFAARISQIFLQGVTSPFVGAGDTDGRRVRRARQRAIEQAFASHAFDLP
jgi:hypothetical protein